jgi:autotransporter adhesin
VNVGQLNNALVAVGANSVAQLESVAAAFGGNAALDANGMLTMPTYAIQGGSYYNAGDAFGAIDGYISTLTARVTTLEQTPVVEVGAGAPLGTGNGLSVGTGSNATGATGTAFGEGASATADGAVAIGQGSLADQANTVSVGSTGHERRVTNVAEGTAATDAANVAQVEASSARTLQSANAYTDGRMKAFSDQFTQLQDDVTLRLNHQDQRIDQQGAMSAAMLNMAINAAHSNSANGRIGVGAGWMNGESALSVGYSKQIGDRASFSLGGAFTSDDSSAGIGFGIDL